MSRLVLCASIEREVSAMKRLSTAALVAVFLCLLVLVFPSAGGSGSGGDGRIVFETNHFCGEMDCGRGDIAVVNPDGSGLRVLTHERAAVRVSESSPRWSPDGREIAYYRPSYIRGHAGGAAQIWLMNADGTHQRQLTHLPRTGPIQLYYGGNLDWTADGRQIVFADGSSRLYAANVATGAVTALKRTRFFWVGYPASSPDGRWIAFVEEPRGNLASWGQIFLLSTVTHHLRVVTHLPKGCSPENPAWSPDSRQIAFNLCGRIYTVNADGTNLHPLKADGVEPSWSPDGSWIVFTEANNLAVMKADGVSRHLITHVPTNNWADSGPDW
jgi:dipeptidyl aminopeptidase/acylaminoacyl peptidase